ncbi:MAG TPA: hypothetical protein VE869_16080 [Gemmatimonas sp.]|nr:hypothetical protein [Gemmatimonas sp.]
MRWTRRQLLHTITPALLMLSTVSTVSCGIVDNDDCVLVGVFALSVTVVDAVTRERPSALPTMRVTDGEFVELVTAFPSSSPPVLNAAAERPGVYRFVVSAGGYQDFTVENVRVGRTGNCDSLRGFRMTVPLVKSS